MQFTAIEQQLIDEYYPGEDELYEGVEEDICPWTFTSDDASPEEFLVMIDAWLGRNTICFTSTRLPYNPDNPDHSINDTYWYMTYKFNKLWEIHVNANMGLSYIGVHQELPEHMDINLVQMFLTFEYIDENGEEKFVDQRSTTHPTRQG